MFDQEKAYQQAVNAIARCSFQQLLHIQCNLSEHILHIVQYQTLKREQEVEPSQDADRTTSPVQ